MRILLGKEQFINSEQFEKMETERLRKEFWKENIELLAFGVIGGTLTAFALVGVLFLAGWY